tara:strand:- start:427 stop:804 length:378 start_codon:yes stop_codon:yes gene_type:complete
VAQGLRELTRESQRERGDPDDESCVKPELRGKGMEDGRSVDGAQLRKVKTRATLAIFFARDATLALGTSRTCFNASARLCASMEGIPGSGFSSTTPWTPSDARVETRTLVCRRFGLTTRDVEAEV